WTSARRSSRSWRPPRSRPTRGRRRAPSRRRQARRLIPPGRSIEGGMPARASPLLAACLVALLVAPGCVTLDFPSESSVGGASVDVPPPPAPAATKPSAKDAGDVRLAWDDVSDPAHAEERQQLQGGALEGWLAATNALLALPYDITVRH